MATPKLKKQIVTEARELFRKTFPDVAERAGCMYLTFCVLIVAQRHGIRLVLQAGTTSWERVTPEQDDGICNTYFSYVWETHSFGTQVAMMQNRLPEMHVWAGDPKTQEVVDLTTGDIPVQCETLTGMDWPGTKPPDYIWHKGADTPRCYYEVDPQATMLAVEMLERALLQRGFHTSS